MLWRWRSTCGDRARAPRVSALRPVSPGEHGAPGARADPAELAGSEPQPAGAWHRPVRQVRAARAPRGCGWQGASPGMGWRRLDLSRVSENWPSAAALGHLQMCARGVGRGDGWRNPFCPYPAGGASFRASTACSAPSGAPWGRAGSSPVDLLTLWPADANPPATAP